MCIRDSRKPASYISAEDGNTDQQKFVTLDEKTGIVTVDKEWLAQGTAAVGRTPIFEVYAFVNEMCIRDSHHAPLGAGDAPGHFRPVAVAGDGERCCGAYRQGGYKKRVFHTCRFGVQR